MQTRRRGAFQAGKRRSWKEPGTRMRPTRPSHRQRLVPRRRPGRCPHRASQAQCGNYLTAIVPWVMLCRFRSFVRSFVDTCCGVSRCVRLFLGPSGDPEWSATSLHYCVRHWQVCNVMCMPRALPKQQALVGLACGVKWNASRRDAAIKGVGGVHHGLLVPRVSHPNARSTCSGSPERRFSRCFFLS